PDSPGGRVGDASPAQSSATGATGKHHPARMRDAEDAKRTAHRAQRAIDKREKALDTAPKHKPPGKPKHGKLSADAPDAKKLPKPPPRADTAKAVGGSGGSSGDARIAAWHAKVVEGTNAIKPKEISDADRYVVNYQAATTKSAKQSGIDKLNLIKSARETV